MANAAKKKVRSWWKQEIYLGRLMLIAICMTTVLTTATTHSAVLTESESVCQTQGCIQAAEQVLKSMDQSVNPCDDFYEFSCGGYRKTTELPADKAQVAAFTVLNDVVKKQLRDVFEEPIKTNELNSFTIPKKLYRACMNTDAIEKENLTTVKQLFKDLGGWPILEGSSWKEADFDWKKFMQTGQMHGESIDSFVSIGIGLSPLNSTRKIMTIDQGIFNIPVDNLVKGFDDEVVDAYYKYLVDLAVYFGATRQFAELEVKNMMDFVIELAKISLSDEQRRDLVALYKVMTVEKLQEGYPAVPWLELINNILGKPERSITSTENVNVVASDTYLNGVIKLLSSTPKRDQANYAMFQILYSKVAYLPDYVRDREQQFNAVLFGTTMRPPRWNECVDVTSQMLGITVGALYGRRYFDEDARRNAYGMISDVRSAFVAIAEKLDWMDEATKKTAIEKALAITFHVGYPNEYLDDKKLDEYYANLKFSSEGYLSMIHDINAFNVDTLLASLFDTENKTDWRSRTPPFTINAQYRIQENSIELLAGILQGVYFNKDRPNYMNYGAIGYIIGHEITHGFDNQGKQFDKEGNVFNWWAEDTNKAYTEKAKCIVDQYSAITDAETGLNVRGLSTQGENIADNGGIKEAYLAYDTWVGRNGAEPTLPGLNFTPKQMFWIASAQCWCSKERVAALKLIINNESHSPNRYRVLVPYGNNANFANDFNCPVGSKMNPEHKCKVW